MQSAIQADSDLAKLTIKVRQQGNSIFLEGDVPSLWIKYKLEGVAKSIDGVNLVDVSGLRVIYSVQKGDTLSQIALDVYGEWTLWKYIAAHNKVLDPYLIYPEQILVIPPPL
jgi:LysM repeat protein